jgi:hypothetical protein
MPRNLLRVIAAASILLIGATAFAQRYQEPDMDDPDTQSCDDAVEEYQTAVKKCLDDAKTLSEAKACSAVEP